MGVATSLGIGAQRVNAGLSFLFGIGSGTGAQVGMIADTVNSMVMPQVPHEWLSLKLHVRASLFDFHLREMLVVHGFPLVRERRRAVAKLASAHNAGIVDPCSVH